MRRLTILCALLCAAWISAVYGKDAPDMPAGKLVSIELVQRSGFNTSEQYAIKTTRGIFFSYHPLRALYGMDIVIRYNDDAPTWVCAPIVNDCVGLA